MVPLGALLSGSLAALVGAPAAVILGGLCCIAGAIAFSKNLARIRIAARQTYVSKGIVPE
jgi:hypothetical protein